MTSIAEHTRHHTRGLSLLLRINWDRLFYATAIVLALWTGSAVGSFLLRG